MIGLDLLGRSAYLAVIVRAVERGTVLRWARLSVRPRMWALRRAAGAAIVALPEALRRWVEVAMVLLHRRALFPAVVLKAARVRAKLRLRPARWVGEAIFILSILRRTGVLIPLLRSGPAGAAAFVHLRARARTKGVVIFRPAIGRLLFSAGLLVDAIVVLFRALLAHAGIRGTLVMRAMALLLAGLFAGVAARSGVASIGLFVAVWFVVVVLVHLRSTVAVLVTVAFGAEIWSTGFAAISVGAAVTVAFRTWSIAARAGVGSARSTLIALAFAGFTTLGAARLAFTGTAEFIGPDFTVAVAIKLPEQVGGAIHLLVINHAVAICIERTEQPGHRALFAFATFGARCAFA